MRNAQKKRVGDVAAHIDSTVAHGRAQAPISAKILKSHASARDAGQNTIKHRVAHGREGKARFRAAMRGCGRTLHFSIAPSTKGWIQRWITTKQQDYYVVFFDFIESSGAGGGT